MTATAPRPLEPKSSFHAPETTPGYQRTPQSAFVGEVRERLAAAARAAAPVVHGTVADAVGLGIRVRGIAPGVGQLVTVRTAAGPLPAQVVAVHPDGATCMPLGAT
ncbi:MAG TPA: hypothetical protein VE781_16820, partial [Kineosporiaceae bacterium]|nr:hypothetical protein [Kineosporiaceae bacterium]